MVEASPGGSEASVRTSGRLPGTKTSVRLTGEEAPMDPGTVTTAPPVQQLHRGPEPNVTKQETRRPSGRRNPQGPKPSARHLEEAAGDVSDFAASLLLACLFCHFSDCLVLLPGTCGLGVGCLCSSLPSGCLCGPAELCCCGCSSCDSVDCGLVDVCQHSAECLELAMEVSALYSCALCLLAALFCEVSVLCSSLPGCVSCGPCGCLSASAPCEPGCVLLGETCRSSDCLDIFLECCALCFPS